MEHIYRSCLELGWLLGVMESIIRRFNYSTNQWHRRSVQVVDVFSQNDSTEAKRIPGLRLLKVVGNIPLKAVVQSQTNSIDIKCISSRGYEIRGTQILEIVNHDNIDWVRKCLNN